MSITEDELKERAVAPRVTFEQVQEAIKSEDYFLLASTLTVCVLTLQNGFTVIGQSACADPTNYKQDLGERIAKSDAINKIWPLLGYELRTKLAATPTTWLDRLKQELFELDAKATKLDVFLGSEGYAKLPEIEQKALVEQKLAMGLYGNALHGRIARASV